MQIQRIDSYRDERFPRGVLNQHGAYLVDGEPYVVEITGPDCAVLRGSDPTVFPELIETFRFHAPHIVRFFDEKGRLIALLPQPTILSVPLEQIQPSQFYVDREKLEAVRSFLRCGKDVVVQVLPWEDRYIALDGHTRHFWAASEGVEAVQAVVSETDDWIWTFVEEAKRRGIYRPQDLQLLEHEDYVIRWDRYCDSVFGREEAFS